MNKKMHGRENDSVKVVEDSPKSDVALREEAMLSFWQDNDIFNKTVATPAGKEPEGDFVFYDGPPFATGLPHYGHILQSTVKDAIPRFWTMNGFRVRRKWGWDCHGLPIENLIEKKLGLATKKDIEEFGVKNFNETARSAIMEFAEDWRQIIPRMGRFVDMENDYKTMDSAYTESVWWVFKQLHEKGLVSEGFKSMHLCPRCGTTLSNFEVNQGYKDIKDIAVTVRLPLVDETDTSLLVWTTTPWTLPGNTAAAVHKELTYAKVKVLGEKEEFVILAKGRIEQLGDREYEVVEEFPGAELVGKKYQPPYPWLQDQDLENKDNAWTIYHADYVEEGEEGTGAVHIAPAYGEDDMNLAKENSVPIFHHVDTDGRFKDFVKDFAGQLVKPKDNDEAKVTHLDADIVVTRSLNEKGVLFKKENITHSYPHCWRCDTPLLNYGTTSWFVEVTKMRDDLVKINEGVKWVPEHVGKNRFGKWLEGARDWAISRQRYWGAPLPIWKNPETGDYKVFGSLEELQQFVPKSGNTYVTMRHGQSTKNTLKVVTDAFDAPYPLTELGEERAREAARNATDAFDVIISSPVMRARETARVVAEEMGYPQDKIVIDDRIKETQHGIYEGKPLDEYKAAYPSGITKFENKPEGGESWSDLRQRTGEFLDFLETEYSGKRILIVSHGDPLAMLHATAAGMSKEETVETYGETYPLKGVMREIIYQRFPHDDIYALDFHRPYIDEIELYEEGVRLERVPDVFDCWFESGSMPFAETGYPYKNLEEGNPPEGVRFPADFIAESVDMTRGWFYSLLVISTAVMGKSPYKSVVTNGLVLAEDGKKMSKSLQNYPDPVELVKRQGADSMRFYLLSSAIIKGEDLNFSEKEVGELQRKNIGRLHNVLAMYEMFADGTDAAADSAHVLDRWIVTRLNQLVTEVTAGYQNYELDKATRPITDFIDDLSVWYLRRSRDRFKGSDDADKQAALATLRHTLQTLALAMAPAMPFYSEYLWQKVKGDSDAESVHLSAWPEAATVDQELLADMAQTREIVTAALEVRTKAGIKVRQPIASVTGPEMADQYQPIVLDELNAKEYAVGEIGIDTDLTPSLLAEGAVRELMRAVQGMRKKEGLEPADQIILTVHTDETGKAALEANKEMLVSTVGASEVVFAETAGESVVLGAHSFIFSFTK